MIYTSFVPTVLENSLPCCANSSNSGSVPIQTVGLDDFHHGALCHPIPNAQESQVGGCICKDSKQSDFLTSVSADATILVAHLLVAILVKMYKMTVNP
jgi:hypothetical protein